MAMNRLEEEQKKKAVVGMKCCCCGKELLDILALAGGKQEIVQSCSPIEVSVDGKFKCSSCADIPEEVIASICEMG